MTNLPCDFLVYKDRGFDPDRILLPTAGGPDSALSAEIAKALQGAYDSEIRLLHVSDNTDAGESFLQEWARDNGLSDTERIVDTGDIEEAIARAATDVTLVVAGASERGLLTRLVRGSPVLGLMDDVDCSVILAERAHDRGLISRLIGR